MLDVDVNMIIANNIQDELKKENKKQVDLAEGIGVSKQTMSKIMNGARAINAIELHKISEYLHVSMHSLMKMPEKSMKTSVIHSFMGRVKTEEWDCVFLDEKTPYISVRRAWHMESGEPVVNTLLKTPAAKRDVPIPKCLVACLKEEREKSESEYVISNSKGTVLTETQFVRVWKYITVRSTAERCYYTYVNGQSIKHRIKPRLGEHQPNNPKLVYTMDFKVTPHMLRHTYITKRTNMWLFSF